MNGSADGKMRVETDRLTRQVERRDKNENSRMSVECDVSKSVFRVCACASSANVLLCFQTSKERQNGAERAQTEA